MNNIELLSPAGDMECLQTAFLYGADAVYVGGPFMQLRSSKVSFDRNTLLQAVGYAHSLGRKIYLTVNCFAKNSEILPLMDYAKFLYDADVDAVIVSDIGAISAIKKASPDLEVHVSTQANCCNYMSVETYYNMGAKRIVLARELSLEEIAEISGLKPKEVELEAFVHGAMCMAYSGRCMISSYLTGRSGNRGECTQPCRWSYYLMEQNRPGEYYQVFEDESSSAILSSHDLCCIDFLDEIIASGVVSLKIEGRMKTPYYVACVTNAYRAALDGTADMSVLKQELESISHRPYAKGFYYGDLIKNCSNDGKYIQKYKFAAVVKEATKGEIIIEQRNRFKLGDELSVLSPGVFGKTFTVADIEDMKGEHRQDAPHPQEILKLSCPLDLEPGDILRVPV